MTSAVNTNGVGLCTKVMGAVYGAARLSVMDNAMHTGGGFFLDVLKLQKANGQWRRMAWNIYRTLSLVPDSHWGKWIGSCLPLDRIDWQTNHSGGHD